MTEYLLDRLEAHLLASLVRVLCIVSPMVGAWCAAAWLCI